MSTDPTAEAFADSTQPAQGSTKDYCESWPADGHNFAATKPAGTSLSVRHCVSCDWIDGEDLERQVAERVERVGICGDRVPSVLGAGPLLVCDLPAGHDGWHGAETGAAQPAGYVPSRCSWTVDGRFEAKREAVVDAARACVKALERRIGERYEHWADSPWLTDETRALIAAVDALDGTP